MLKIATRLVLCFFAFLVCSYAAYGQESCQLERERYDAELNNTDKKVVTEAVKKLRDRCPYVILARLKHPDDGVRYRTAWAIAELRGAEFTAAMGERLRDSSADVRYEAAWFMVELKVPGYQLVMSELLNDPSEKVRNEARAYMDIFGASAARSQSTSSGCGEMCEALKKVLAMRDNDFAGFRGEIIKFGAAAEKYYWRSTFVLPGATRCTVRPKVSFNKYAEFGCIFPERPLAEADPYFDQLVASVRAAMPSNWRVEDRMEGMISSSGTDIRRFYAGPNLDLGNDVYVVYLFLSRWDTGKSHITLDIKGK